MSDRTARYKPVRVPDLPDVTAVSAGDRFSLATQLHVTASDCKDVFFVGARGSDEKGPGNGDWRPTATDPAGLGRTIAKAHELVRTELRGRTLETRSVNYLAGSVRELLPLPPTRPIQPDVYFSGIGGGVDDLDRTLRTRSQECPGERIVLAGFSQGAMVVHRLVHRYLAIESRQPILDRIDAVLLVGDGDRLPNDQTTVFGSARRETNGIGLVWPSQSGTVNRTLPAELRSRVLQVCNTGDTVCDPRLPPPPTHPVTVGTALAGGIAIHLTYTVGRPLHEGARAAAQNVLRALR